MERDAHLYRVGCGAALIAGPALFYPALLLLGSAWAGASILRLEDAELAAGRP